MQSSQQKLPSRVDGKVQSSPDILIGTDGLVCAPDETAAEEGDEQDDAVIPLIFRAGEVQFVKKPVNVEKGGGELVEDKSWAVESEKRSLSAKDQRISITCIG